MVFVVSALESIAASKDARQTKRKPLLDSTQRALSAIRNAQGDAAQLDPEILFQPLNLATDVPTVSVVVTALDCIGKLISYSYFSVPKPVEGQEHQPPKAPLIERAIDTICDCFQGEATAPEVQMQIIKSLLAAILNDKIVVHGAGLLKSVRQTYNIFLLSKHSASQQIAQGSLTQMVGTVFERVKVRLAGKAARYGSSRNSLGHENATNGSDTPGGLDGSETPRPEDLDTPVDGEGDTATMTLQDFEKKKSFDDTRISDTTTTVTRARRATLIKQASRTASGAELPTITVQGEGNEAYTEDEEEDEIYIKDAFLVFRAMCKLSTKTVRRRVPDRRPRPVGGCARRRRDGADDLGAGLPRQRAAALRLRRPRGRRDPPPGRAAAAAPLAGRRGDAGRHGRRHGGVPRPDRPTRHVGRRRAARR